MKPEEIKKIAEAVFKKVPAAKKAYITSDGQGFANKNMADLHKQTNARRVKLAIYEIDNPLPASVAVDEAGKKKDKKVIVMKATPENRQPDDLNGADQPATATNEGTGASEPAADAATATQEGAAKKSSKNPKNSN